MKKKFVASSKDKKDWMLYTKQIGHLNPKDIDILEKNTEINKIQKLDLHGFSLVEANRIVKKFITESFENDCRKILIITGKGLRSKSHDNPYISKELSVLKYSVPEYIKNNKYLKNRISRITTADVKDGGEGAIYIFLKNKKNFKE